MARLKLYREASRRRIEAALLGCRALLHGHLAPSTSLPMLVIRGIAVYGGLLLRYNRKVLNVQGGLPFGGRLSGAF